MLKSARNIIIYKWEVFGYHYDSIYGIYVSPCGKLAKEKKTFQLDFCKITVVGRLFNSLASKHLKIDV